MDTTYNLTGYVMSEDRIVAEFNDGNLVSLDEQLAPLFLKRTKDIEAWLVSRAIDSHRTNSRLLKKVLRLHRTEDIEAVLRVNAANITDRYWFKDLYSSLTYEDIRFKENLFDKLALKGDSAGFSLKPAPTPELTNIGSFEKCWRLIDNEWWMYKAENKEELFSELFIYTLGNKLGLDFAHYEYDEGYIRTLNFLTGKNLIFESMTGFTDNDEYDVCFDIISSISEELAEQYIKIIWFDTVCFNMDRHTDNFGFLRDPDTGRIVSMAPNYDNNIALISRGYHPDVTRKNDGLIKFFREFLESSEKARIICRRIDFPLVTGDMIDECFSEMPELGVDYEYVKKYILSGQEIVSSLIDALV